jgi:hypothetical protein
MAEVKKAISNIKNKIKKSGSAKKCTDLDLSEIKIGKITGELKKML